MCLEGASVTIKNPIISLADVTELMLVGAFDGISKFYIGPQNQMRNQGLIWYLRQAVNFVGVGNPALANSAGELVREQTVTGSVFAKGRLIIAIGTRIISLIESFIAGQY